MANDTNLISNAVSSIPIGELVRAMAMAVADAQFALDRSSLMMAEFMSGRRPLRDIDSGRILSDTQGAPEYQDTRVQFGYTLDESGARSPAWLSMLELGFVPNFYQFVDTVIEVKLALRVSQTAPAVDPRTGAVSEATAHGWTTSGAGLTVSSTPIDAGYAASYSFNLELASVFKTKLVPVPPPAVLEDRLRELVRESALQPTPATGDPGTPATTTTKEPQP